MSSQAKTLGTAAVALIAVVFLGRTVMKSCSKAGLHAEAASVQQAVVYRLAQAVKENHEPGKVLFIRHLGYIAETEKVQEAYSKSFRSGLGSGWDIVELPPESWDSSTHGDWTLRARGGQWEREMLDWVSQHSDAVAAVSAVGIPRMNQEGWDKTPPFYSLVYDSTDGYVQHAVSTAGMVAGIAYEKPDLNPLEVRQFKGSATELFDFACQYQPGSAR